MALADGIASGYNTGILKGQPVALNTSGNIIAATAGSAPSTRPPSSSATPPVKPPVTSSGLFGKWGGK